MDYGESSEPWDESVADEGEGWEEIELEEDVDPTPVTVTVQFKSGLQKEWTFTLPKSGPGYDESITKSGMLDLITNAYSYGESPFIILPLDDGANVFLDLGATDYMELR